MFSLADILHFKVCAESHKNNGEFKPMYYRCTHPIDSLFHELQSRLLDMLWLRDKTLNRIASSSPLWFNIELKCSL